MSIPVANYKKIAFSSQFRYMNISSKGTATATIPNTAFTDGTVTVAHNLGYNPFFRVFIQFPGDSKVFSVGSGPNTYALISDYEVDNIHADSTNLYVSLFKNSAGGGTFTVYYRIYKEQR